MKRLWAPWRLQYIRGDKERGCVFCKRRKRKRDREDLIIHRGRRNFVMMNKFPYNNGHLMIIPYKHTGEIDRLPSEDRLEMLDLLQNSVQALKRAYRPQGFNWGMNQGRAAGAGIADHIHLHVVPRWSADTNFMPVLSETRCLPDHLERSWKLIRKKWRGEK